MVGSDLYTKFFLKGLKPDTRLLVSDWADQNIRLSSKNASEPGLYRTSRTPYVREIADCLSPSSKVETVVFMKGSQVGGTQIFTNWVGFIIDQNPAPTMIVQPTEALAKKYSRQRIDPMIAENPKLQEKVRPPRERDSGNSVLLKEFVGGLLNLAGANSSVGLRSLPIKYLGLDEVDAYPEDIDDEGSPIELAIARTRTFSRKKIFIVSTPTVDGRSKIQAEFEETDQRFYHVPCPHCGEKQSLKWSQVKYEIEKIGSKETPLNVRYECEHNGCHIFEHHKTEMFALGEWVAKFPERSQKRRGYHLSALYSPVGWFSWEDCVLDWLKARKNPNKLRVFVNTILGEVWTEKGDAPDWEELYRRREDYKINTVPNGAYFLVCGVDIQADRIEAQIVAYGPELESWSIDYRVFVGSTSTDQPWDELKKILQETWEMPWGGRAPIRMMAVDSGFNTQRVYNWVRQFPSNRVIAVKGQDTLPVIVGHPKHVDITLGGKKIPRGLLLYSVGVSVIKTELYGYLKLKPPLADEVYQPGFIHFPEYAPDYFKQLTAEQLVLRKNKKGQTKFEWEKSGRNEALDTFVYARAAAAVLGVDRLKEDAWEKIKKQVVEPLSDNTSQVQTKRDEPRKKRRESSFW